MLCFEGLTAAFWIVTGLKPALRTHDLNKHEPRLSGHHTCRPLSSPQSQSSDEDAAEETLSASVRDRLDDLHAVASPAPDSTMPLDPASEDEQASQVGHILSRWYITGHAMHTLLLVGQSIKSAGIMLHQMPQAGLPPLHSSSYQRPCRGCRVRRRPHQRRRPSWAAPSAATAGMAAASAAPPTAQRQK